MAAGYLWILFICLLAHIGEQQPHSGLGEELVRLGNALSPVGLAVAVSFVAYLLGSFTHGILQSLWSAITDRFAIAGGVRISQRGHEALDELLASRVSAGALTNADDAADLANDIVDELDLIKTRLLAAKRDLHHEIDRLHSEADFRGAVVLPLAAVLVVAVLAIPVGVNGWAGFEKPLVQFMLIMGVGWLALLLAAQASNINKRANDKVVDALLLDQVSSPTLERWDREAGLAS